MLTETKPQEITPPESVVPVYLVPLTAEELEARNAQEAADAAARVAEEAERGALRAAALGKLVALGLTEDEAVALAGG